jgi:pimeloyl-ACP methyl ester carboxylesterase
MLEAPGYPGACVAEREYDFDARGQRLRVYEWGDPSARPVLLCHGYWDNAHGFDTLAPLLAQHYRVVAFDARGHGESAWVDQYHWYQAVYDLVHLLEHIGAAQRVLLIGHSYGGGVATACTCIAPQWVDKLVNIDGFGPGTPEHPLPGVPDPSEHSSLAELREYLDQRRRVPRFVGFRPYAELGQLVARYDQLTYLERLAHMTQLTQRLAALSHTLEPSRPRAEWPGEVYRLDRPSHSRTASDTGDDR